MSRRWRLELGVARVTFNRLVLPHLRNIALHCITQRISSNIKDVEVHPPRSALWWAMSEAPSPEPPPRKPSTKPFGPHSRALKAGTTLDGLIDPDSPEGRYVRVEPQWADRRPAQNPAQQRQRQRRVR
jgi:hypothetical protein